MRQIEIMTDHDIASNNNNNNISKTWKYERNIRRRMHIVVMPHNKNATNMINKQK